MNRDSSSNLIIGGGLAGVVTAWVLSRQGYPGVLLEKNAALGGGNRSFRNDRGDVFDYGGHWIYARRSEFTSRFFTHVQGEEKVRRFPLQRGIYLDGTLIPYASPLDEWPERFRKRIEVQPGGPSPELGNTREEFARSYGDWFANLIFEDVLDSFPICRWRKSNGVAEKNLMRWIYPWFFPLTDLERTPDANHDAEDVFIAESRNYHHWIRHADGAEEALYPRENGFGNWVSSIAQQIGDPMDVQTGIAELSSSIDPDSLNVTSVSADGRTYEPERVFWCAPFSILASILDWEVPPATPQKAVLGSFSFDRPIQTSYHEILFGDPDHPIRRVTFPQKLAGQAESHTCQVELMFPEGNINRSADDWEASWLNSLRETGLISDHQPVEVKVDEVPIGVVLNRDIQDFIEEKKGEVRSKSDNLVLPDVNIGPGNSSRSVPRIFNNVYDDLLSN